MEVGLFSSILLWTSMKCTYCVAIVFICLNVLMLFVTRRFTLVSKHCIKSIFEVALALATKTMIGVAFHPLIAMLLTSGWHLVGFLLRVFVANLSLVVCRHDKLCG